MSTSDIIAVVGLAVSVLGIPLTYFLARRTKQRPELRFALDFDSILSPDSNLFDRGLFMTLGTHRIDSISRTRIAFWNHRGDTIHKTDLLADDPLRLQLEDGDEALQARVLSSSRKQINIAARIDPLSPSAVQIDFSFLDVNDGAIIEVIHRGPARPELLGILQGSDIRNVGSESLGTDFLKAATQKSRIRRRFANTSKIDFIAPAAMITVMVTFFAFLLIFPNQYQANHLISLARYNLHSIAGQVAFAKAVANIKAYNDSADAVTNWLFAALIIAVFLMLIFWSFPLFRKKVPWGIAKYRPNLEKNESEGSKMQPSSEGDQASSPAAS